MYTIAYTSYSPMGDDPDHIHIAFADTDEDLMVFLGITLSLPVYPTDLFDDDDPFYLDMDESEFREYLRDSVEEGLSMSYILKRAIQTIESEFYGDGSFSVTAVTVVKGRKEILAVD